MKVSLTKRSITVIEPNEAGVHVSYPLDGRLHHTEPQRCQGSQHSFIKQHSALSNVTLEQFYTVQVPAGGPPEGLTPSARNPTGQLVVDPPAEGVGSIHIAAVGDRYAQQVEDYLANNTSSTTHRIGRMEGWTFLVVYDPTGGQL